jgi:hypothetical protein
MAKILKIIGRFISGFFEWLLIIIIFLAFAVRSIPIQTFLAQKATNYLSKELNTTFRIDRLSIVFFHKVALDGVYVEDLKKDTIASIGTVFVTLKSFSQTKNLLALDQVYLQDGVININRSKETGDYNYDFIVDYFSSDKPSSKTKPIDVTVEEIKLSSVDFSYHDNRKEHGTFGMDYDYLDFKNVFLTAGRISIKDGTFSTFIKHFSAQERSGFSLKRLSTYAVVSDEGLKLKNLYIETDESNIFMPRMNLLMHSLADFQTFEDSVIFDVKIDESTVSLKDISYFASAMEGMDQIVQLEAVVTKQVKNLKFANLKLYTGERTQIVGTVNLPDFRNLDESFIQEKLEYVYLDLVDLGNFKLPYSSSGSQHVALSDLVRRIGYFEANDLKIDGFFSQFVLEIEKLKTDIGTVHLDHGILFSRNKQKNSFAFEESESSDYDLLIDSLDLGKLLGESSIGILSGKMFMNGELFIDEGEINFNKINGELDRFHFNEYTYKNIQISDASFINNLFEGKVDVQDENLFLAYNGSLDFNKRQHFMFDVVIEKAHLNHLNFIDSDTIIVFSSTFTADLAGTDINNYSGIVDLDSLKYKAGDKSFDVPKMAIQIQRSFENDRLSLQSKILTADIEGKIDLNTIAQDFLNQSSRILPALFSHKKIPKSKIDNEFKFNLNIGDITDILDVFVPDLDIQSGTTIIGDFNGKTDDFVMDINSPYVRYGKIFATDVELHQEFHNASLDANYKMKTFHLNDSISVVNASFISSGGNGGLHSTLSWNPLTSNSSFFEWNTEILGLDKINLEILPSYFNIKQHRWDIARIAQISIEPKHIHIDNFLMKRENQFISVDGALSEIQSESLVIQTNDFQLEDFSEISSLSGGLKGVVNARVVLSDPYSNMRFIGEAEIADFYVNNQEVGDVNVAGYWDKVKESINLNGDLIYKKEKTFTFQGDYYTKRKKNSLDFTLDFDHTDVQFVNAFMDPKVVSNIKGLLSGKIEVAGSIQEPEIYGNVMLNGGNAKIAMFGVNFGIDGKIMVSKDMIAFDGIPIIDEEGNTGAATGTIFHENFSDWNFDFGININDYYDRDLRREVKVKHFLVMNTKYEEGIIYYGKAYATGDVNISGYADNLDIQVNLKTQANTQINFPMFGASDIDENQSFTWVDKSLPLPIPGDKIDFTGVNLDLNIEVTPDAIVKLIFDDITGDEITATGTGNIGIKLNNLNDLTMEGTYTVNKGKYNFVLSAIKKPFDIKPGGTITWNGGGAEDATLNLTALYTVMANVGEIAPELESKKSTSSNQTVYCNLFLSGNLADPLIRFNIEAPKASESARSAIARINSDQDELNRQFFSLLIGNKFQGTGAAGYGSSAALDALTSQINSVLGELSKDVRLNVGLHSDQPSGINSQEIGFETNVLNDKLSIRGSFGVENNSGTSQSTVIGNLNLEYILDETGNFRVSIFNESNSYSVIQDKNVGQFTQGIGLQYKDQFHNYKDFRALQVFLDFFRTDKHIKFTKTRRQKAVPK